MTKRAWGLAIAMAFAGCSKSNHGPASPAACTVTDSSYSVVSCTFAAAFGCDQIGGTMTNCEIGALDSACTNGGGAFSSAGCSTAGSVPGLCYYADASAMTGVPVAAGAVMNEFYYSGGWTLASAQAYCASPPAGVWISTP